MTRRTWAIISGLGLAALVAVGLFGGPDVFHVRKPKKVVACQNDPACRSFIKRQIAEALKGVVAGGGNNPSGPTGGPAPPPQPFAQLCVQHPNLAGCVTLPPILP